MTDLDELKRLASAASEGPWTVFDPEDSMFTYGIDAKSGYGVVMFGSGCNEGIRDVKNAEYIAAANPAVVLELIAEIERLRGLSGKPKGEQ